MITIHPSVLSKFDLSVRYSVIRGVRVEEESEALEKFMIRGVRVEEESEALEKFKETVATEVRKRYSLETIKDYSLETIKDEDVFREYRDFFWQLGIDPTKKRPAAEALTRRILQGKSIPREKSIPRVNTLVDSYNLASIKTGIPMGAFDLDRLDGALTLRFADGEEFLGIGMEEPIVLRDVLVVSDEKKLIAMYPYRDADDPVSLLAADRAFSFFGLRQFAQYVCTSALLHL